MKEYTIKELLKLSGKGELSSESLVIQYLERIEDVDNKTNAIIEINPEALKIAKERDEERKNGNVRGPLHGIPVVLKDNIDTADKMMTTAGSLALEGNYATEDAFIVKLLRDAGAIILAKANLSEWANFRGKRSISGWSSRGRQTRNPYALDRNPCGSSSGSAVAVAANLTAVAIGTETDGSVICPANTNGIVGIKPTIGLVSRSGIIPIAHSQDTAGPMARTVEDAAILLGALVGHDESDKVTSKAQQGHSDYTQFLNKDGLKGARLGFSRSIMETVPKVKRLMDDVLQQLRDLGAELVEFDNFPKVKGVGAAEFEIMLYEFKCNLNKYLGNLSEKVKVHSIEEVLAFNKENSDTVLPYFGDEFLANANAKGDLESEEYLDAQKKAEELRVKIKEFMNENKLDALISPSGAPAWLIDHINGDSYTGLTSTTYIAAVTGFSNITVPAGYIQGLPVGLSFIGRAFAEPSIIKLGFAFEQSTNARKKPRFLRTIKTE